MRHTLKFFLICTIISVSLILFTSSAIAQGLWDFPAWTQNPITIPDQGAASEILVDDFEYWGISPLNHGWVTVPDLDNYFMSIWYYSYAQVRICYDYETENNVLDVYYALDRIYNNVKLFRDISTPASSDSDPVLDYIDLYEHPILSFKVREPIDNVLSLQPEDLFEFDVIGFSEADHDVVVKIIPNNTTYDTSTVTDFSQQALEVKVSIGKNFDGSWQVCRIDLYEAVKEAVDNFDGISAKSDWYMTKADSITVSGTMFRLDDIIFRRSNNLGPRLFPVYHYIYTQIFEPCRYLFVAEYRACDGAANVMDLLLMDSNGRMPEDDLYNVADLQNIFETDPNAIEAYWLGEGADPNSFDPNHPSYLTPDSGITAAMGCDFVIYPWVPIFTDPNFRFNAGGIVGDPNNPKYPNPAFGDMAGTSGINQTLQWNATVGSLGANGVQLEKLAPLAISPLDGMPTYIPAYGNAGDVAAIYGVPFFGPNVVTALEGALYNAGFTFWPNIAAIDFTPQVFEDIILTIEVTDGVNSDHLTFPIFVVNYPVANYPPIADYVSSHTACVGEEFECLITALDADCFIFDLSIFYTGNWGFDSSHPPMIPGNQIRNDMDNLSYECWSISRNGRTIYHKSLIYYIGPWWQRLFSGCLFSYTFYSEDEYDVLAIVTDDRGASSTADFTVYCNDCSYPFINHSPIIMNSPEDTIIARAGQEVVISAPDIEVMDPDGDTLYASCNIGSVCQYTDNGFMNWSFMTHYPGLYNVEIIFSDRKGGYATMDFQVDVRPWWSYE